MSPSIRPKKKVYKKLENHSSSISDRKRVALNKFLYHYIQLQEFVLDTYIYIYIYSVVSIYKYPYCLRNMSHII